MKDGRVLFSRKKRMGGSEEDEARVVRKLRTFFKRMID